MIRLALIAPLCLSLLVSGCGYHISGRGDTMPKTLHTVAINSFGNNTLRYKLAGLLPADIGRELVSRTKYRLVPAAGEADAVLSGSLVNYSAFATVVDPNTYAATTVQVIVIVNITLTERATGKVLYTRQGFEVRERYEIASKLQQYFDESSTAMERLSRDVARTVVSGILEGF
jgi:hypothetical protein